MKSFLTYFVIVLAGFAVLAVIAGVCALLVWIVVCSELPVWAALCVDIVIASAAIAAGLTLGG